MIDWFHILSELQKAGINNSEVARRLNVPAWKVQDWKQGKEPRYHFGVMLMSIYKRNCAKSDRNYVNKAAGLTQETNSDI